MIVMQMDQKTASDLFLHKFCFLAKKKRKILSSPQLID
ncbi:hypothetical protein CTO_1014 [Chlamydia trachomatis A2497]|uniref:Uncharacterized protein n=1 Tax=Chlamydia trachomatis serovar A (strain A2497) TaxID=580047 RepID=G4NPN8_CHLT4|nr:hypothetical protein CTO_1014 [Chlamydia trachomatis A2497]